MTVKILLTLCPLRMTDVNVDPSIPLDAWGKVPRKLISSYLQRITRKTSEL